MKEKVGEGEECCVRGLKDVPVERNGKHSEYNVLPDC